MGAVFAATNTWTGKRVAIKTLHPQMALKQATVQRFWQEARAATKVQHPNIIDVLDMGMDERAGVPFIVQEFLDGVTLEALLEQRGRLSAEEAVNILLPVCGALVATHRVGVVHRDMKPANIFLVRTPHGVTPKVIDFGISKIVEESPQGSNTQTGFVLGTPSYMSPEQAAGRNREVDATADVWAMGVVFFEALSGRLPFEADTPQVTLAKILYEPVPSLAAFEPGLPTDLVSVVERALRKEKSERFPSIARMTEALLECAVARASGLQSTVRLDAVAEPTTVTSMPTPERDEAPPTVALGTMSVERVPLGANETLGGSAPLGATRLSATPSSPSPSPMSPAPRTQMQWAEGAGTLDANSTQRRPWGAVAGVLVALVVAGGLFAFARVGASTAPQARVEVPVTVVPQTVVQGHADATISALPTTLSHALAPSPVLAPTQTPPTAPAPPVVAVLAPQERPPVQTTTRRERRTRLPAAQVPTRPPAAHVPTRPTTTRPTTTRQPTPGGLLTPLGSYP